MLSCPTTTEGDVWRRGPDVDRSVYGLPAPNGFPAPCPAIAGGAPPPIPIRHAHGPDHEIRTLWWVPQLLVFTIIAAGAALSVVAGPGLPVPSGGWWVITVATHAPFVIILCFLVGGLVERLGYLRVGRCASDPGQMREHPTVCVQLPMFNEHAVARRVIEAAAAMAWPRDRLTIQVLDDSTDADTRDLVDAVCAEVRTAAGVDCRVLRRTERAGYKAGALEAGRRATGAEFLVIFDSDFVPPADFLERVLPHFYLADGRPDHDLALVQAQWGHLNHDESALTLAQSLWVDDHHTVQMSWRSAMWDFVNFTGTAGVWRASAIERVGGWRAASLVEDCELSFRHLFEGFRTKFVKEIVAPAELPATYTAYKAQQRRWTQGWVQLQRLHLATLLVRHRCAPLRKLHLVYHMCISWQWPIWAIWTLVLPVLIHTGFWFGAFGGTLGLAIYVGPMLVWLTVATVIASVDTRHTYAGPMTPSGLVDRFARVVPYVLLNTGMMPHQCTAFAEGLFGSMHSEFERTPKAASITVGVAGATEPETRRVQHVKVHWPYVLTEVAIAAYLVGWALVFASTGLYSCAIGAAAFAGCIVGLMYFYGDHADRVCFVIPRRHSLRVPDQAGTTTNMRSHSVAT